MNLTPEFVLILLYFFWLLVLTFLFFKFYFYYSKLTRNGKKESLSQIINDVMKKQDEVRREIAQFEKRYDKLERDGVSHMQKVGLVRFNPFKDTGGDQSFILSLVDAENTGVVISSLHTRTGTRWYAKGVIRGKGVEHELSKEEEKALSGENLLTTENKALVQGQSVKKQSSTN